MTDRVPPGIRKSLLRTAYCRDHEPVSPVSHVVCFWVLLSAGASLFAASVLSPMWQERQAVLAAETLAQQRLDGLHAEWEQTQVIMRALEKDPAINRHDALRELNYHVPGHEVVPTQPERLDEATRASSAKPRTIRVLWRWELPPSWYSFDAWVDYVSTSKVRRAFLLAAAVLVSAAFILFAPPSPRSRPIIVPELPRSGPCEDHEESP